MDPFFENPGLCHIGESILKNLDFQTQLICQLVKKSWKNTLEKVLVRKASKINLMKELQLAEIEKEDDLNIWLQFLKELKQTELANYILKPYLQLVLRRTSSIIGIDSYSPPLVTFAMRGNLRMVQYKLELEPIPISEEWGMDHRDALEFSAMCGKVNVVKYLKDFFSTAIPMRTRQLAIWRAASNGHLDVLKVLIDDLANPNDAVPVTITSSSSFAHVIHNGHIEVLKYFEEKLTKDHFESCLTIHPYPLSANVFHLAADKGHLEILKYLYRKSPKNIFQLNVIGDTPIHIAAKKGHLEVVEYLTTLTSNPNIANKLGQTPSSIARFKGFYEIENYLLSLPISKKIKI